MPRPFSLLALAAVALAFAAGCSRSKLVTIEAYPRDSLIRVGDKVRGRGPVQETFTFSDATDRYRVSAEREGYKTYVESVTRDDPRERISITLKPVPRPVTFSITPLPAIVSINGKRINEVPALQVDTQLVFQVDDTGKWNRLTVKAERKDFEPYTKEVKFEDRQNLYVLDLQAKRKTFVIATSPDKADVYVNGESRGISPVTLENFEFPVDRQTGDFDRHKVRVEKKGYQTRDEVISWDDGQENYEWTLEPLKKVVRITTAPKGATVTITPSRTPEVSADAAGAHSRELVFGPPDEQGKLKVFNCKVTAPSTDDQQWEEHTFPIGWDAGQTDYPVKLKEILVRNVTLLRSRMKRNDDGTWTVAGETLNTVAVKDTGESSAAKRPTRVTNGAKGQVLDTLAVSPDGSQLVYTVLSETSGQLHSRIVAQKTDGSGEARDLTDGTSLDVAPSFTPDGSKIVFASTRGGRRLSVWAMSASDNAPAPERLTIPVDTQDLSPAVDSNPKPRLFYETYIDGRPGPRVYSTEIGAMLPRDLARAGGTQPRVSPTADAVLFTVRDPKTAKRDIFRMSDDGRDVTNLTNTPETDEFDAIWSGDGLRIAYVSDQGRSKDAPDNCDIWVMDAAGGSEPVRVTTNPSLDDCPAWGEDGRAVYFRSNRGGQWNAWRIELK